MEKSIIEQLGIQRAHHYRGVVQRSMTKLRLVEE